MLLSVHNEITEEKDRKIKQLRLVIKKLEEENARYKKHNFEVNKNQ